jgi:putative FmdB family regulatory protein
MTYEYECQVCDHPFETETTGQRWRPQCPACGSRQTERVFSAPQIIYKGEGWPSKEKEG